MTLRLKPEGFRDRYKTRFFEKTLWQHEVERNHDFCFQNDAFPSPCTHTAVKLTKFKLLECP